jgi:hypothetical protein
VADAVAKATGGRDAIRANLFDPDASSRQRAAAAITAVPAVPADRMDLSARVAAPPCDLNAATDAVNGYQQAVLSIGA